MHVKSPNRLVVAVLLNRLFGWSENFITRELVELQRQGVEIHVGAKTIEQRDDLTPEEQSLQHNFFSVPENAYTPACLWKHVIFTMQHPLRCLKAWGALLTLRRRRLSYIGRSFACLFRAVALADVLLTKKVDVIHAHFLGTPTETALYLSKLTRIPFGCTGHAGDIYKANATKLAQAKYIITCTDANATYLQSIESSIRSKLFVVHHGLCLSKAPYNGTTSKESFTFLAVGRLVLTKGLSYLVEACGLLQANNYQFRCLIVGEGPLRHELQAHVQRLRLFDKVDFIGYVAPHHMPAIYQSGNALVVPSIIDQNGDRDGLPNVCLEAMAQGLPVIGTHISGIPEAVTEGVTGLLVPPRDPHALSDAMVTLLTSSHLETMGKAGYDVVREKFDLHKNVRVLKSIIERYQSVMAL